jgi:hypothetical protein
LHEHGIKDTEVLYCSQVSDFTTLKYPLMKDDFTGLNERAKLVCDEIFGRFAIDDPD